MHLSGNKTLPDLHPASSRGDDLAPAVENAGKIRISKKGINASTCEDEKIPAK